MNRQGFSLIELLIAASLFLAAVIAFNYVLKVGSLSIESAQQLNHAVYALQSQRENISTYPFDSLPYLNGRKFADGAGKIRITPVLADLTQVELELAWHPKKVPLKMSTLRSKYE